MKWFYSVLDWLFPLKPPYGYRFDSMEDARKFVNERIGTVNSDGRLIDGAVIRCYDPSDKPPVVVGIEWSLAPKHSETESAVTK